jgi:hypothetical protein
VYCDSQQQPTDPTTKEYNMNVTIDWFAVKGTQHPSGLAQYEVFCGHVSRGVFVASSYDEALHLAQHS